MQGERREPTLRGLEKTLSWWAELLIAALFFPPSELTQPSALSVGFLLQYGYAVIGL